MKIENLTINDDKLNEVIERKIIDPICMNLYGKNTDFLSKAFEKAFTKN